MKQFFTRTMNYILYLKVFHLKVPVVHTLAVTMSNCIYQLLKVPSRLNFGKLLLENLTDQLYIIVII